MLLSSLACAAGLRLPASGQPTTWSRRAACALPFALPLAAVAGKPLPASHAHSCGTAVSMCEAANRRCVALRRWSGPRAGAVPGHAHRVLLLARPRPLPRGVGVRRCAEGRAGQSSGGGDSARRGPRTSGSVEARHGAVRDVRGEQRRGQGDLLVPVRAFFEPPPPPPPPPSTGADTRSPGAKPTPHPRRESEKIIHFRSERPAEPVWDGEGRWGRARVAFRVTVGCGLG